MRPALVLVLGSLVFAGCTRATNDGAPVTGDPAQKPLPPSPSTTPSPTPKVVDARVCEPPVGCGVWGECFFFEPLPGDRFRGVDGAVKDQIYVRRVDCYPADAGPSGCTRYCSGAGGGPPCVDGLHPIDEICTGSAMPRPAPHRCEIRDDKCVRVP